MNGTSTSRWVNALIREVRLDDISNPTIKRYLNEVNLSNRTPHPDLFSLNNRHKDYEAYTKLVPVPRLALNTLIYVLEILEEHVVPFAPFIGPDFLLIRDYARSPLLAADIVHDELSITSEDCLPRSPEMNPIEHVWAILKKRNSAELLSLNSTWIGASYLWRERTYQTKPSKI